MSPAPRNRPSGRWRLLAPDKVPQTLVEPILHPSRWRIRALGLSCAFGHPLFYAIWTSWVPQPYERLWQRLGVSLLGLMLLTVPSLHAQPPSRGATLFISLLFWLTLPVFFTWMYLCNERNASWFASMAIMFLIYYHLTDWRIATLGLVTGIVAGAGLFELAGPAVAPTPLEEIITHSVVFGFAWYMGLILGISSSNLRREQLKQALGTMGILAHELRTPLSTLTLVGAALRDQARQVPPQQAHPLERLTDRLHSTVRLMNRHIDTQIINARLMQLPLGNDTVDAAQVVLESVQSFPYRSVQERDCVEVVVVRNFHFQGSQALFAQVVNNLVKNALRSLAAQPEPPRTGDLRLEIDQAPGRARKGLVLVQDRGQGMSAQLQRRLFTPFVSTSQDTAHGLGLAFCQRVIQASRGSIRVRSAPGRGACFIIELPLL